MSGARARVRTCATVARWVTHDLLPRVYVYRSTSSARTARAVVNAMNNGCGRARAQFAHARSCRIFAAPQARGGGARRVRGAAVPRAGAG